MEASAAGDELGSTPEPTIVQPPGTTPKPAYPSRDAQQQQQAEQHLRLDESAQFSEELEDRGEPPSSSSKATSSVPRPARFPRGSQVCVAASDPVHDPAPHKATSAASLPLSATCPTSLALKLACRGASAIAESNS